MVQQTVSVGEATSFDQTQLRPSLEDRERQVVDNVKAIMADVAVQVGALIDGVGCKFAQIVDWQYYPPSTASASRSNSNDEMICFAITENEKGLHSGGYIELSLPPGEEVLRAKGGYYDTCYQPTAVYEKSLPLRRLDRQKLGQALMEVYDRVIREYGPHVCHVS